MQFWYRYEDHLHVSLWDESRATVCIVLQKFEVIKETPCGVRLETGRFVDRNARKRFACPTEAEAMESFIARKKRQARILSAQLKRTNEALQLAQRQGLTVAVNTP